MLQLLDAYMALIRDKQILNQEFFLIHHIQELKNFQILKKLYRIGLCDFYTQ